MLSSTFLETQFYNTLNSIYHTVVGGIDDLILKELTFIHVL